MNSILQMMNRQVQPQNNIIDRYKEFANSIKDPDKQLEELVNSGRVTKEQVETANEIVKLITGKSAI